MKNLVQCGTCGYPLTQEERTGLVEIDGVMMKPAQQEPVSGVVIREGLPTLLRDHDIKPTDTRLYTHPPAQRKPVAWVVTAEAQDGTRRTFAMMGRLKDAKDCCDFGEPIPLYESPPAQQEPVGWQPIETAPKDGQMILVCLPRQMDLVVRAWYRDSKGFWLTDQETDGGISRPAWFYEGDLWHPIPPIPDTTGSNT